jgi:hypothetical protein
MVEAWGASLSAYLARGEQALQGWPPERLHLFRLDLDRQLARLTSQGTARLWLEAAARIAAPTGDEVLDDLLAEPLGLLHGLSDVLGSRAARPGWLTASVWGGLGVSAELAERLQLACWRLASALRADTAWADWWEAVAPVPECHVVLGACLPDAANDFFEEGVFRKRRLLLVVRQQPAEEYAGLDDDGLTHKVADALLSCIQAAAVKVKARQAPPSAPPDVGRLAGS